MNATCTLDSAVIGVNCGRGIFKWKHINANERTNLALFTLTLRNDTSHNGLLWCCHVMTASLFIIGTITAKPHSGLLFIAGNNGVVT